MSALRTFLQIMRDAGEMRRAGCSVVVSLMSTIGDDDQEAQILWDRLMSSAKLEAALRRQDNRRAKQAEQQEAAE